MNFLSTPARRKILFGALYMSEAAPIGFIWWALPTMLRAENIAIDRITGLASLLILPWAFKFLWAPLVDVVRTPRWPLQSWILASQLVMGCALVPLLVIDPLQEFELMALFLFIHAFAVATQDVAIDALCITEAPVSERGALNGWMQVGMLTSRSLLGGGTLIVGEILGRTFYCSASNASLHLVILVKI